MTPRELNSVKRDGASSGSGGFVVVQPSSNSKKSELFEFALISAIILSVTAPRLVSQEESPSVVGLTLFIAVAISVLALASRRFAVSQIVTILAPASFYPPVGPQVNFSLADLFVVAALAIYVIHTYHGVSGQRATRSSAPTLLWYGWLLQLTLVFSLLLASFSGSVSFNGLAAVAKLLLMVAAALVVVLDVSGDRSQLLILLRTWRATAVVVACLGVVGYILHSAGVATGLVFAFRAIGSFEDPNAFATYLLISVGVSLAVSYILGARPLSWHLVPIVFGILLSGSRAAFVTAGLVAVVAFVAAGWGRAASQLRAAVVGVSAVGVLAATLLSDSLLEPVVSRLQVFAERGLSDDPLRESLWNAAFELWHERPFFGIGIGQFPAVAAGEHIGNDGALVHNTYLSFLAETGVVGTGALLWLPLVIVIRLVARRGVDPLAPFILVSVSAFAIMAASLNLENFRPFWLLVGICLASFDVSRKGVSTR